MTRFLQMASPDSLHLTSTPQECKRCIYEVGRGLGILPTWEGNVLPSQSAGFSKAAQVI